MPTVSVVIPAYNERENITQTLESIPAAELRSAGYAVEVLVVDNASTDGTGRLAREYGAKVVVQPVRGYGNAYKAGFANSIGDLIATGDADLTYPFQILPDALAKLADERLDFLSTNRLRNVSTEAMTRSHIFGNWALSRMARLLFGVPFEDSQSGMWIFRRAVWEQLRLRSGGMAFSQELKVSAFWHGFRCAEVPITYFPRGGETKMRTVVDGIGNLAQLFSCRVRGPIRRPSSARAGLTHAVSIGTPPVSVDWEYSPGGGKSMVGRQERGHQRQPSARSNSR